MKDIGYALRKLGKSPGFTLVAGLTLALGIGASATIFSLVSAFLIKPLPYHDPDRLVILWETSPRGARNNVISPANYLDWIARGDAFERTSIILDRRVNLTGSGEPEELSGLSVEPGYLGLLGVEPAIGRAFAENEGTPESAPVAIISNRLWQRRFGSSPSMVGEAITLDGAPHTIVGIMPAGFRPLLDHTDVWLPIRLDPALDYREQAGRYLLAIGRLRDRVPLEQAQTQLSSIAQQLEQEHPRFNKGWGVNVVPLREQLTREARPALLVLFGAVCFLLLIACANVANLLLSRAASREKEIAIRASLGAERGRLTRQLLAESLLLAAIGGAAGWVLAIWGRDAVLAFGADYLPEMGQVSLDWRVLAFAIALTGFTGILAGLAPALTATRGSLAAPLKEGGRGTSSGRRGLRLRNAFVVAQVGLSAVLLIGAGLMITSFLRLQAVDPGFAAGHVLTVQVNLPRARYKKPAARVAFFDRAVKGLRALPGVQSASGTVFLPFAGLASATDFTIEGRPEPPPGEDWVAEVRIVKPQYFRTMGIPVIRGRAFDERDTADAPRTFLINQALAKLYWPGADPLGHRMVVDMGDDVPGVIIGVVGDVKHYGLDQAARPTVYYSHPHLPFSFMSLVIRTSGDPTALAGAARAMVTEIDPDQPISSIRSMEDRLAASVAPQRFRMLLLLLFSGSALLLAGLGIYGVVAYSVSQRVREVGIRVALGASPADVVSMVMRQAVRYALIGAAIGAFAAAGLSQVIGTMLFEAGDRDAMVYGAVLATLVVIAVLAGLLPARRAVRVQPLQSLRYE